MWQSEDFDSRNGVSDDMGDVPPSAAVALRLADTLEKDVTELKPLGNRFDTDALNRICEQHPETNLRVEFTHEGCRIEVENDTVNVSKLDQASD